VTKKQLDKIIEKISHKNIGKWKLSPYRHEVEKIMPIISRMLQQLSYDI